MLSLLVICLAMVSKSHRDKPRPFRPGALWVLEHGMLWIKTHKLCLANTDRCWLMSKEMTTVFRGGNTFSFFRKIGPAKSVTNSAVCELSLQNHRFTDLG